MRLRDTKPLKGRAGSNRLVVLVHGWWGKLRLFSVQDVEDAVREELPDADLMVPKYPSGVMSNTDPVLVCQRLSDEIELALQERESEGGCYSEIVLIGFSLGALMVRKTFILGCTGQVDGFHLECPQPACWVEKTGRIILLAGCNRGWSIREGDTPKEPWLILTLLYDFFSMVTWVFPICGLIRSFMRGQPFTENMRIQWHELERKCPDLVPPTIQLWGTKEDVVTINDMRDIAYCRNFIFLLVPDTGHLGAADFHDARLGRIRRERFLQALKSPISELESQSRGALLQAAAGESEALDEPQPAVQHVVYIVHGIRDYGLTWLKELKDCVERIARENNLVVHVDNSAYTWFPMLGFLIGRTRRKKVRWFVARYTNDFAKFPNARFHFIGHSYGTYLLGDALRRYDPIRFHRVALAGSVLPRSFPWNRLCRERRVECIRNDMAADDWVVAVFPRFLEQVSENTPFSLGDIGGGGV